MSAVLTTPELTRLVEEWLRAGRRVHGPVRLGPERVLYRPLTAAAELTMSGFIRPANAIKDCVFPRHQKLYGYRLKDKGVELTAVSAPAPEQIVIGARPCDAAALPILDPVFNWETRDEVYNRRRAATTVVTLACAAHDDACFCTSVGLSPIAERGSDALLLPLAGDRYAVRCLTDKGRALLGHVAATDAAPSPAAVTEGPAPRFEAAAVRAFLETHFEHPVWQTATRRCLGCGACAYTCPTCHCFDIVDEGNAQGGCRAMNWDACQFALFTAHASGHNPRADQAQRQRQRIQHKFRIYPEKFNAILCTGCGNCLRQCPAGLGVAHVLDAIGQARA